MVCSLDIIFFLETKGEAENCGICRMLGGQVPKQSQHRPAKLLCQSALNQTGFIPDSVALPNSFSSSLSNLFSPPILSSSISLPLLCRHLRPSHDGGTYQKQKGRYPGRPVRAPLVRNLFRCLDSPLTVIAVDRTPQNTPANNAPISSHAQEPGISSIKEGNFPLPLAHPFRPAF